MKIQVESIGRVTLVCPLGRLDFSAAADFQIQVERALAGNGMAPSGMLMDCAALDYISSAGLRVFLIATRTAKRCGIAFAVCSVKPAVKEVFDISGFDQLMNIYADRSSAQAQMRP